MKNVKVLFVCGSMEPGRDGVGDYTRELAGALHSIGVEAEIIAIMDRDAAGILKEPQSARDKNINVTRLSKFLSFSKRKKEYQNLVAEFKPDFISLQYVPYAFSPKGIPLTLSTFLKLENHISNWHFMIHEVYIGTKGHFKNKIIQRLQIAALKMLVNRLQPSVIHTTVPSYQSQLKTIGVGSDILGLFGNIPISKSFSRDHTDKTFRGVYFGAPPKEDNFQNFINAINQYLHKTDDMMEVVLCGQSGEKGKKFAAALRNGINSKRFDIVEKGRMAADELSNLFLTRDFAIARISPYLLGKSGSAIAMLEHGLPLWVPLAQSQLEINESFDFRLSQCFFDLYELKGSKHSFYPGSRLEEIANSFIQKLITYEDSVV